MNREERLKSCRDLFKGKPGWLIDLHDELKLSKGDVRFLEDYDQECREVEKELKQEYYAKHYPELRQEIQEFTREMYQDDKIKSLRIDSIVLEIKELREKLDKAYKAYVESENEEWLREVVWDLNRSSDYVRKIQSLTAELEILKGRESERISESEIQDVLQKQMKDVVERLGIEVRNGMISCPFHPDKTPSANVRKNFFYCHSCQKNLNTISFLKEQGMSFKEAVEFLKTI